MKDWTVADRISDGIIDIANRELDAMRAAGTVDPFQLLAGQLLGLLSLARTMPPVRPASVARALGAAHVCLAELIATGDADVFNHVIERARKQ